MKKVFILLLAVVALLAFTIPAMALHAVKEGYEFTPTVVKSKKAQLTFDGSIRIRGRMSDNITDFRDTDNTLTASSTDDSYERYDQRIRLGLDAVVSPNTMGHLELENGGNTDDSYTWGADGGDAKGIYGEGNIKIGTLSVRQAYIAHQGTGLTGNMAGFKAGHMLLSLGDGWFYNHTQYGDDAIVLFMQPADGTEVSLTAIKLNEGSNTSAHDTSFTRSVSDDANAYVLAITTMAGGADISADITWVNDNQFGVGGTPTDIAAGGYDMNLYNFGLRGSLAIENININADVELQTGDIAKYRAGSDMDIGGWAFILGADTKINDIGVWLKGGIGSGDDIDDNKEYDQFITSLSEGQKFAYVYDNFAKTAATGGPATTGASSSYTGSSNTGIANTTFIGLGASANVNPDVKVEGAFYWLQATEKVAQNVANTSTDSKDIGYEIDGKITYQIDTNLVWYLETGWLFADDFYKNVTLSATDTKDPDDAYSVRHGLVLSF